MRGRLFLVGVLGFAVVSPLYARWDRVGPEGGRVRDIAIEKGILYAAGTGLFRSADNGANWQRTAYPFSSFGTDSADPFIACIAVKPGDPRVVFAGGPQGLYKTTNSGTAWQKVSSLPVRALAFSTQGTRLCAACPGAVLTGLHPFTAFSTFTAPDFNALSADPLHTDAFLAARSVPDTTGHTLMISENGGQAWNPFSELTALATDLACVSDGSAWLASTADGLARIERTGTVSIIHANPSRATAYFPGGSGGIFNITEAGSVVVQYNLSADWTSLSTGMQSRQPGCVAIGTDSLPICGTDFGGILEFLDRWNVRNNGLYMAETTSVSVLTDTARSWIASAGDGLYKSTNQGDSWTAIHSSAGSAPPAVSGLRILHDGLTGLARSDDGGKVWRAFQTGLPAGADIVQVLWRDSGDTAFAVTSAQAVYRNTTSNSNWKSILPALETPTGDVPVLAIAPGTPTTMYLVRPGEGLLRTDNSGADWTTVNASVTADDTVLAVSPTDANTLFRASQDGNGVTVWKSSDGGAVWSQLYHESAAAGTGFRATMLAVDPRQPSRILLGTNRGLRVSGNGGVNWGTEGTGPAGTFVAGWSPCGDFKDFLTTRGGGVLVGTPQGIINARGCCSIITSANSGLDPTVNQIRAWDGNDDGVITMRDVEIALRGVVGG